MIKNVSDPLLEYQKLVMAILTSLRLLIVTDSVDFPSFQSFRLSYFSFRHHLSFSLHWPSISHHFLLNLTLPSDYTRLQFRGVHHAWQHHKPHLSTPQPNILHTLPGPSLSAATTAVCIVVRLCVYGVCICRVPLLPATNDWGHVTASPRQVDEQ